MKLNKTIATILTVATIMTSPVVLAVNSKDLPAHLAACDEAEKTGEQIMNAVTRGVSIKQIRDAIKAANSDEALIVYVTERYIDLVEMDTKLLNTSTKRKLHCYEAVLTYYGVE